MLLRNWAVNLIGVLGNPTLPSKYKLRDGYIIGPDVDLSGVDLTDVDL